METVKLQNQIRHMLGKHSLRNLLKKYYPLLAILIGVTLISIAMGPYLTLDTDLEFSTAQGVLRWGYPYINAWGNLFNEPPLGFYTEAAVFHVFGFSVANGVALITLFGLACTVAVIPGRQGTLQRNHRLVCRGLLCLGPLGTHPKPQFSHRRPMPALQPHLPLLWYIGYS